MRLIGLVSGLVLSVLCTVAPTSLAFTPVVPTSRRTLSSSTLSSSSFTVSSAVIRPSAGALYSTTKDKKNVETAVEETTEKYGLEAGLFQSLKEKDGGESAKSLLKKYGIAYLATSIPLALISFVICYLLVDNGVDVGALLAKIGIESQAGEKAGTFAIAYAAHKAASPIRFPPTVVLTPVVAKLIGKEPNKDDE